jgi:hypothetical protein
LFTLIRRSAAALPGFADFRPTIPGGIADAQTKNPALRRGSCFQERYSSSGLSIILTIGLTALLAGPILLAGLALLLLAGLRLSAALLAGLLLTGIALTLLALVRLLLIAWHQFVPSVIAPGPGSLTRPSRDGSVAEPALRVPSRT